MVKKHFIFFSILGILGLMLLAGMAVFYFGELKEVKEPPRPGGQEFTLVGPIQATFGKLSIGNGGVRVSATTDSAGVTRQRLTAGLYFHTQGSDTEDERYVVSTGWSAQIGTYEVFVEEIEINRFFGQGRIRLRVWENR